jgi:hypothetical protein
MTIKPQHMIVMIIPKGMNIAMWYMTANICNIGLILRRIEIGNL